jgi:hypothetical protein
MDILGIILKEAHELVYMTAAHADKFYIVCTG